MKSHVKTKIATAIACCTLSIQPAFAEKVVAKDDLGYVVSTLDTNVIKSNPNKYKAYVTMDSNNIQKMSRYGFVSVHNVNNTMSVGTGQCVGLIQGSSNAKHTSKWYGEKKVTPGKTLPKYTPIATLTKKRPDGKMGYDGYDGKSHVAYYIRHQGNGIIVFHQNFHNDLQLSFDYIPFSGKDQGNAGNYYILEQD